MAKFPVVKGLKMRATKVNSCGLPQAGPAAYAVTDAFVTVGWSPVMKDADELEQKNAEGRTCVLDRTPPERKYYTLTVTLCQANTCMISMFNSWVQELDWDGNPVGFRDQRRVESDFGVAVEVWTGGRAGSDCPAPTNDEIFSSSGSGKVYGYALTWGTEFTLGDIEIGASVVNFQLTGITFPAPQWGRGPWNVVSTDSSDTPGRLLTPVGADQQFLLQRTPVPPPDSTPGDGCCPMAITGVFADPDFYFGGPADEPAADIAPPQAGCGTTEVQIVTITGTPTGGTFTLTFDGQTTANIAYNAIASAVASALIALSNIPAGGVVVTGGPGPGTPWTVTFAAALAGNAQPQMTADDALLTGGTTPVVTVTTSVEGGE